MQKLYVLKNMVLHICAFALCICLSTDLSAGSHLRSGRALHIDPTTKAASSKPADEVWKLIYSDSLIKVSATEIVCSGNNSLKLRIENLGTAELNLSYKLWSESAASKSVKLSSKQVFSGICAPEYNNLLVEAIPAGHTASDTQVQITY